MRSRATERRGQGASRSAPSPSPHREGTCSRVAHRPAERPLWRPSPQPAPRTRREGRGSPRSDRSAGPRTARTARSAPGARATRGRSWSRHPAHRRTRASRPRGRTPRAGRARARQPPDGAGDSRPARAAERATASRRATLKTLSHPRGRLSSRTQCRLASVRWRAGAAAHCSRGGVICGGGRSISRRLQRERRLLRPTPDPRGRSAARGRRGGRARARRPLRTSCAGRPGERCRSRRARVARIAVAGPARPGVVSVRRRRAHALALDGAFLGAAERASTRTDVGRGSDGSHSPCSERAPRGPATRRRSTSCRFRACSSA